MSSRPALGVARRHRIRKALERHYGDVCWYCKRSFPLGQLTIEHLLPRSLGGTNAMTNLRWACSPCNQERGRQDDPHARPSSGVAAEEPR